MKYIIIFVLLFVGCAERTLPVEVEQEQIKINLTSRTVSAKSETLTGATIWSRTVGTLPSMTTKYYLYSDGPEQVYLECTLHRYTMTKIGDKITGKWKLVE